MAFEIYQQQHQKKYILGALLSSAMLAKKRFNCVFYIYILDVEISTDVCVSCYSPVLKVFRVYITSCNTAVYTGYHNLNETFILIIHVLN